MARAQQKDTATSLSPVWQTLLSSGLAVLTVIALHPSVAAADDRAAFSIRSRPVWFLMGGVTGGGTVGLDDRGGFVGGEMSLVRMRGYGFLGLYADGYYDFGVDATYITGGPELGLIRRSRALPIGFGIDGGAALRLADGTDIGATGRVFINVAGAFSVYGRYMHFGAEENDRVIQVGAMLKFPLLSPFGQSRR